MASKLPLLLLCTLVIAVQSRLTLGSPLQEELRARRSPDSDESWVDKIKNVASKAADTVKEGYGKASDKISEIGENIKNSDIYEKASSEFNKAGEKVSSGFNSAKETVSGWGENIKNTDAFKGAKEGVNKAAEAIKDKLDD